MREVLQNSMFFGTALTLICFELATFIKLKLKHPIFNPFLIATLLIIGVLLLLGINYDSYFESSQHLGFFATPSTVCLAVPLYRKLEVLKKNLPAVIGGITAGVFANILAISAMCLLFNLGHIEYVSLLPKSITTPIGVALAGEYGGIASITILAIMFSGIVGNMVGEVMFRLVRIKHPVSRGLALGTCSHGIGTAKAMELGETEGAMSGLSIAITGVLTVFIAPFFTNLI